MSQPTTVVGATSVLRSKGPLTGPVDLYARQPERGLGCAARRGGPRCWAWAVGVSGKGTLMTRCAAADAGQRPVCTRVGVDRVTVIGGEVAYGHSRGCLSCGTKTSWDGDKGAGALAVW